MEELNEIIEKATSKIDRLYFQLEIDGGEPIFRERVYCYELYHQMRKNWPPQTQFVLNGEVDKRAHPILKKLGADHTIPDFVSDIPQNWKSFVLFNNYIIKEIEIPKDVKDSRLLRIMAIRKGKMLRSVEINGEIIEKQYSIIV